MARNKHITKPSPYPLTFTPTDLKREIVTDRQVRFDTETIKYGPDDALPLRVIKAVDSSPAATQCIDEIKRFIQGSSFTDEALMDIVVDPDGTTLWDLHGQICDYMALLDGFSVNFKYNIERKITSAYCIGLENCRFVRPDVEKSKEIRTIKYNPYFGTQEFKEEYTTPYQAFDLDVVTQGIKTEGNDYPGQIYYYGKERPLYKFYPVPKYWTSGENAIYADAAVYEYHKNNLDNSFLLSTLMNVIGDPNAESQNPKYRKTKLHSDGVTTIDDGSTHTVGQEFSEMMAENFSGVKKAGSVMALWSLNQDEAAKIKSFPSSTNFETIEGTLNSVIRGVAIATGVQAILANLPQQASSLGSDGNSMRAAVELMLSRVAARQRTLELFYNTVLLPNLAEPVKGKVKIKNYIPISTPVEIDQKYWDFMNDQEKAEFINENVPNVNIQPRVSAPITVEPAPEPTQQDQALKGLKLSEIDRIGKIKSRLHTGKVTHDEAVMILKGFGFSDDQVTTFLQLNGEEV